MNIYTELNKIIEYIETHLEEEIKYDTLAKMLGVNEYIMQRLFCLLTNISLSEYIRNRRLSSAGVDLQNSNNKIVDIAIKYQYDNATSFSRAFERFHGIKPSIVKENPEKLKIFTKIIFNEDVPVQNNMEYSIVQYDEFILWGKGIETTTDSISEDAPRYFQEFFDKYLDKYGYPEFGMTVYENRAESDKLEYWILYNREIENFRKYVIPKGKWISLKVPSQEAKEIQEVTNKFYLDFLPSSKYRLRNLPELEYYHDDITEFLIPIE